MLEPQKIQKIVATGFRRTVLPSSQEEMIGFKIERIRPEFADPEVIAVQFLQFFGTEDGEEPEKSHWYINPEYCKDYEGKSHIFNSDYNYGPCMDAKFLPEILVLNFDDPENIIKAYEVFLLDYESEIACSTEIDDTVQLFMEKYPELIRDI